MFGNPETTPGGRALKFYASVRLDVRKIETLRNGTDIIGSRTKVKVVKNKVAPPFKEIEFDILFGQGISKTGELVDIGSDLGVLDKSGTWYSFGADRIGQGRENVKKFLLAPENADIARKIEAAVKEKLGLAAAPPEPEKEKTKEKAKP